MARHGGWVAATIDAYQFVLPLASYGRPTREGEAHGKSGQTARTRRLVPRIRRAGGKPGNLGGSPCRRRKTSSVRPLFSNGRPFFRSEAHRLADPASEHRPTSLSFDLPQGASQNIGATRRQREIEPSVVGDGQCSRIATAMW